MKKTIQADEKDATGMRIDILKDRLALQRSRNKSDRMRDMLRKVEADLRSELKSGSSAAVAADKAAIKSIKTAMADLNKEQKDIATLLRSDIKKDVATHKALVKTIAKDEKAYKADLASTSGTKVSVAQSVGSGTNHHLVAALHMRNSATTSSPRAGFRPAVHPVVHPVDKK